MRPASNTAWSGYCNLVFGGRCGFYDRNFIEPFWLQVKSPNSFARLTLQYVYLREMPLKNLNKDGRSTFCVPYLFESSACRAKVPLALVPKFEFLKI